MKHKFFSSIFFLLVFAQVVPLEVISFQSDKYQDLELVPVFEELSFNNPIDFKSPNDDSNRIFIAEQSGKIKMFNNNNLTSESAVVLDINSKTSFGGERGLLGLAFHPDFKENNYIFIDYTAKADGATIIERYTFPSDSKQVDLTSEMEIIKIDQPYSNHNAGGIVFGKDGFLYITLGDGGSGGDPQGNAQDRKTLLGSILRIDVDKKENGNNYAIPIDNPFVGNSDGFKEEIFAYGLRNPWRISVDSKTGDVWVGDVGQNAYEEIDVIKKGKNYGWNTMEGFSCYNSDTCSEEGLELPIFAYGRSNGTTVVGGYVYRGSAINSLVGIYLFADFYTGNIWALEYEGLSDPKVDLIFETDYTISTFGIDSNKEIFIVDYTGSIYKLQSKLYTEPTSTSLLSSSNFVPTTNGFNILTTISFCCLILISKKKNC